MGKRTDTEGVRTQQLFAEVIHQVIVEEVAAAADHAMQEADLRLIANPRPR